MSYPTPRVEMPPSSLLDLPWFAFLLASLLWVRRIYLGIHSLIDIIGGLAFGLAILAFWISFVLDVKILLVIVQQLKYIEGHQMAAKDALTVYLEPKKQAILQVCIIGRKPFAVVRVEV
ncbi:hypothetical protein CsSME_00032277 [Camellia sinensis var. sinensis]